MDVYIGVETLGKKNFSSLFIHKDVKEMFEYLKRNGKFMWDVECPIDIHDYIDKQSCAIWKS